MNRALCNACSAVVPARQETREGEIFLVKDCPSCGKTETLTSSDAQRYFDKHKLDAPFTYSDCTLACLDCRHRPPNLVFLDVTNRCNLNCPICINNTPSMGFLFEPPLEYFENIFDHFSRYQPRPVFQLFGGEPTVRKDLLQIVDLARSYGISTRLVTNGLRLTDPELCRELVKRRVTILISYDGANPQIYSALRGTSKILDQKVKAIDNCAGLPKAKMVLMSLVAKGFNDRDLPELFDFCHKRRNTIRGIYFMPLAHTWGRETLNLEPERITSEDVENIVDSAFPDNRIDFIPAGFLGQIPGLRKYLGIARIPFAGAHPNCESMYVLVSDGERYIPVAQYLKGSTLDLAQDLLAAEGVLAACMKGLETGLGGRMLSALGATDAYLRLRAHVAAMGVVWREVRLARLFKGRGLGRLFHASLAPIELLLGRKLGSALARHTEVQGALQLIVLPFEDRTTMETERLERCPTAFAYYDPVEDEVRHVPVCSWHMHKTAVMEAIAKHYAAGALKSGVEAARDPSGRQASRKAA